MKITIYISPEGQATVRWPAGLIPDSETVRRVAQILNEAAAERRETEKPA